MLEGVFYSQKELRAQVFTESFQVWEINSVHVQAWTLRKLMLTIIIPYINFVFAYTLSSFPKICHGNYK